MKIDASRYRAFWENPDKFRIREGWKLEPIPPKADSVAGMLSFGRRRGTAFHEMMDANYRQVPEEVVIQELRDGGFGEKEINEARAMAQAAIERYGADEYLAHEVLFDSPIPGSPHSLVGRIDSIVRRDDEIFVRDYKTSKYRSKSALASKGREYCNGPQVGFYLLGARALGFDARRFVYSLVSSGTDSTGIQINEYSTERTSIQLNELMRSVHITCELILWLVEKFGIQKHWVVLPEQFTSGYEPILGKSCYFGYLPDGFQERNEHLPIARIL